MFQEYHWFMTKKVMQYVYHHISVGTLSYYYYYTSVGIRFITIQEYALDETLFGNTERTY